MTPQELQVRVALLERAAQDIGSDVQALQPVPQAVALLTAEVAALRADVREIKTEKQSSKATTAALIIAAISAFATLGAAAITLAGTTP